MVLKELALILESGADWLVGVNVALTTIDNWHIAKTEWNNAASENVHNIRSNIPALAIKSIGGYVRKTACTHMRSTFVSTPIVR